MNKARVLDLHHAGKSEAVIAAIMRLQRITVRRILVEEGIARAAHATRAHATGNDLADPQRADRLLRKF